ncbi:hypothetical protein CEUSTIGMA_g7852.t1 [Chlamydomonas eustigma]|uniref:Uncharacterized protein n=1 Tax=Chlamydomonas eustigma TaxID=1157962 RepID=A0A250XBF0_9CHLO|nr:hypothetical protein CEUSTIGMA_g7852.t1 [Chlamydomonas eustigma]|eukprot:GAX80413.1 hypothetical protein CEUSTIGMA_g7852.t1 [Chlamydomonas eustigma]
MQKRTSASARVLDSHAQVVHPPTTGDGAVAAVQVTQLSAAVARYVSMGTHAAVAPTLVSYNSSQNRALVIGLSVTFGVLGLIGLVLCIYYCTKASTSKADNAYVSNQEMTAAGVPGGGYYANPYPAVHPPPSQGYNPYAGAMTGTPPQVNSVNTTAPTPAGYYPAPPAPTPAGYYPAPPAPTPAGYYPAPPAPTPAGYYPAPPAPAPAGYYPEPPAPTPAGYYPAPPAPTPAGYYPAPPAPTPAGYYPAPPAPTPAGYYPAPPAPTPAGYYPAPPAPAPAGYYPAPPAPTPAGYPPPGAAVATGYPAPAYMAPR